MKDSLRNVVNLAAGGDFCFVENSGRRFGCADFLW